MENNASIIVDNKVADNNFSVAYLIKNKQDLVLHLADNTLILSQRNSEWCGHGPVLEQDIALTNISLDLLGQARNFYQYAAALITANSAVLQIDNTTISKENPLPIVSEDSLAYFRTEREFKNCLLVEQPNNNWGQTILRQFLFSTYQYLLYAQLQHSKDETLAAIATKAFKEVGYHVKWSSEWVIRLGDGTAESHQKMLEAMETLWPFTGELFIPAKYEQEEFMGFDLSLLQQAWFEKVKLVLEEATLLSTVFENGQPVKIFMQTGGKQGVHSEYMGFILTDLQYIQRTYPGAEW